MLYVFKCAKHANFSTIGKFVNLLILAIQSGSRICEVSKSLDFLRNEGLSRIAGGTVPVDPVTIVSNETECVYTP